MKIIVTFCLLSMLVAGTSLAEKPKHAAHPSVACEAGWWVYRAPLEYMKVRKGHQSNIEWIETFVDSGYLWIYGKEPVGGEREKAATDQVKDQSPCPDGYARVPYYQTGVHGIRVPSDCKAAREGYICLKNSKMRRPRKKGKQ